MSTAVVIPDSACDEETDSKRKPESASTNNTKPSTGTSSGSTSLSRENTDTTPTTEEGKGDSPLPSQSRYTPLPEEAKTKGETAGETPADEQNEEEEELQEDKEAVRPALTIADYLATPRGVEGGPVINEDPRVVAILKMRLRNVFRNWWMGARTSMVVAMEDAGRMQLRYRYFSWWWFKHFSVDNDVNSAKPKLRIRCKFVVPPGVRVAASTLKESMKVCGHEDAKTLLEDCFDGQDIPMASVVLRNRDAENNIEVFEHPTTSRLAFSSAATLPEPQALKCIGSLGQNEVVQYEGHLAGKTLCFVQDRDRYFPPMRAKTPIASTRLVADCGELTGPSGTTTSNVPDVGQSASVAVEGGESASQQREGGLYKTASSKEKVATVGPQKSIGVSEKRVPLTKDEIMRRRVDNDVMAYFSPVKKPPATHKYFTCPHCKKLNSLPIVAPGTLFRCGICRELFDTAG